MWNQSIFSGTYILFRVWKALVASLGVSALSSLYVPESRDKFWHLLCLPCGWMPLCPSGPEMGAPAHECDLALCAVDGYCWPFTSLPGIGLCLPLYLPLFLLPSSSLRHRSDSAFPWERKYGKVLPNTSATGPWKKSDEVEHSFHMLPLLPGVS